MPRWLMGCAAGSGHEPATEIWAPDWATAVARAAQQGCYPLPEGSALLIQGGDPNVPVYPSSSGWRSGGFAGAYIGNPPATGGGGGSGAGGGQPGATPAVIGGVDLSFLTQPIGGTGIPVAVPVALVVLWALGVFGSGGGRRR